MQADAGGMQTMEDTTGSASANGAASITVSGGAESGIFRLDLSDETPEQKPVEITTRDGTRRVVKGYCSGSRALRSVESAFLAAWRIGHTSTGVTDSEGNVVHNEDGSIQRKIVQTDRFDEAVTNMLLAVLPNMTYDEADRTTTIEAIALLKYLGWYKEGPKA